MCNWLFQTLMQSRTYRAPLQKIIFLYWVTHVITTNTSFDLYWLKLKYNLETSPSISLFLTFTYDLKTWHTLRWANLTDNWAISASNKHKRSWIEDESAYFYWEFILYRVYLAVIKTVSWIGMDKSRVLHTYKKKNQRLTLIIELSFFVHILSYCSQLIFTSCDLDLWPTDMKKYTAPPLVVIYIPTKFDGDRLKNKGDIAFHSKW